GDERFPSQVVKLWGSHLACQATWQARCLPHVPSVLSRLYNNPATRTNFEGTMPDAPPSPPLNPTATVPPAVPPRFSWPMRFFLGFLLFDMAFRGFAVLAPTKDWCEDLEIRQFPEALPTAEERSKLAQKTSAENPDPVGDAVWESLDSAWYYFRP